MFAGAGVDGNILLQEWAESDVPRPGFNFASSPLILNRQM